MMPPPSKAINLPIGKPIRKRPATPEDRTEARARALPSHGEPSGPAGTELPGASSRAPRSPADNGESGSTSHGRPLRGTSAFRTRLLDQSRGRGELVSAPETFLQNKGPPRRQRARSE
ncbi:hypothetical protein CCHR01_01615 [Colletotrichum chrysophilum]|uniref:Uncharacterized protein n=1 Tax=Colletotrichum chrysophilum TaxID=1836956 RepID=A0AAD9AYN6_9PEZI|nr:hypothetical protein CCHR01_01615 [Colletotrichum chrysophilum]